MSELLTYRNILNDISEFKRSGYKHGDDFNAYDTPSHKYFKILFYFGSKSDDYNTDDISGLLAPTWEIYNYIFNEAYKEVAMMDGKITKEELFGLDQYTGGAATGIADYAFFKNMAYNYNSAWSYLMINDEKERADKLEKFVTLLSDISSKSPWYFSSISGVQEALERKVTEDGKLDMTEPKKLSITCIPDAYDNRITTLLELYRDVTWSWIHKKEIIPANLRKFDMAIYIFETPTQKYHKELNEVGESDTIGNNGYKLSYKMLEFHDCEFNYNSIKSGWGELNNETGVSPKYTIDISYNDCYEVSYNEMLIDTLGDVILTDLYAINKASSIDYQANRIEKMYLSSREYDELLTSKSVNVKNLYYSFPAKNIFGLEYPLTVASQNSLPDTIEGLPDKPLGHTETVISADTNTDLSTPGNISTKTSKSNLLENFKTEFNTGFISNAVGQVAGHLKADIKSVFNKAILGNIHTYSLTRIGDQVQDLLSGNLIKTGMTVKQYINDAKQRQKDGQKALPVGNIHVSTSNKDQRPPTGNIFNKSSIANNI